MSFRIGFQKYNPTGYRYYRLLIIENNGNADWCGLESLRLMEEIGGANVAIHGGLDGTDNGIPSASSAESGFSANYCFDGPRMNYTQWKTDISENALPAWVQFTFNSEKIIREYTVITPNHTGGTASGSGYDSAPHHFKLQYSYDGIEWNDADEQDGIVFAAESMVQTFTTGLEPTIGEWEDWTKYKASAGRISTKVESENPGQAGVTVYDGYEVEFLYSPIVFGETNPVYTAFSGNRDAQPRFIFKVEAIRNAVEPITDDTDANGDDVVVIGGENYAIKSRFFGMCDFGSIKTPVYTDDDGENIFLIKFNIADKLSAMAIIEAYGSPRKFTQIFDHIDAKYTGKNVNAMVLVTDSEKAGGTYQAIPDQCLRWRVYLFDNGLNIIWDGRQPVQQSEVLFQPGDLIRTCPMDSGWVGVTWLVVKSELVYDPDQFTSGSWDRQYYTLLTVCQYSLPGGEGDLVYTDTTNWRDGTGLKNIGPAINDIGYGYTFEQTFEPGSGSFSIYGYGDANFRTHAYVRDQLDREYPVGSGLHDMINCGVLSKEYFGVDFGIYNILTGVLEAYDVIEFIKAFVLQRWPDIEIVNNLIRSADPTDPDYDLTYDAYKMPLSYYEQLLTSYPLDQEALDALISLGKNMNCYIYINKDGNIVLENKNATLLRTTKTIPIEKITSNDKDHFWDKIRDEVKVSVKSWFPNMVPTVDSAGHTTYQWDGTYLDGAGSALKLPGIKAKNSMSFELYVDEERMLLYGITYDSAGLHWDGEEHLRGGKICLFASADNFTGLPIAAIDEADELKDMKILNMYADQISFEYFEFYGKRHSAYQLSFTGVTWEMLDWQVLDTFIYMGAKYFITKLDINENEKSMDIELVEMEGHNYGVNNIVFGRSDDAQAGSVSGSSVAGFGAQYGGNTTIGIFIPLVGNIQANSAEVVWATNIPGDSKIIYGSSPDDMTSEAELSSRIFYHTMILLGLDLEQDYYCQAISVSATGKTATSPIMSFSTGKETIIYVTNFPTGSWIFARITRQEHNFILADGFTFDSEDNTADGDGQDGNIPGALIDVSLLEKVEINKGFTFVPADTLTFTATTN